MAVKRKQDFRTPFTFPGVEKSAKKLQLGNVYKHSMWHLCNIEVNIVTDKLDTLLNGVETQSMCSVAMW